MQDIADSFGGFERALKKECKVTDLVQRILRYAFKKEKMGLFIECEQEYIIFGEKKKPDLEIISAQEKEETLFIIEVKKALEMNNLHSRGRTWKKLDEALPQNFKQMRYYSIKHRAMSAIGLVTNFKEFVFTSYSMKNEIDATLKQCQEGSKKPQMQQIYDQMKDQNMREEMNKQTEQVKYENSFEMSQSYRILDDTLHIDQDQLESVIQILKWLPTYRIQ